MFESSPEHLPAQPDELREVLVGEVRVLLAEMDLASVQVDVAALLALRTGEVRLRQVLVRLLRPLEVLHPEIRVPQGRVHIEDPLVELDFQDLPGGLELLDGPGIVSLVVGILPEPSAP